ncbi:hypothetical protein SVAN01_00338 [Stagonosporopsis vannaccii]|nr:hypothetical protein SVAN01_00338 [Stagonosporopsis vannaccii]
MEQNHSLEKADPYLQVPLDLHSESIRLLELLPTSDSTMIKCRLQPYLMKTHYPSFTAPSYMRVRKPFDSHVSYTALSYKWDHTSPVDEIKLNDCKFFISRTLWWFLYRMHQRGKHGLFWIDAICINQSSIAERNHQVPLMQQIYSQADTVAIWLGEHVKGTNTDMAMNYLVKATHLDVLQWRDRAPIVGQRLLKAVVALANHQYWSRVWIIQEVHLASSAQIYSGAMIIELEVLNDFLSSQETISHYWEHVGDTLCRRVLKARLGKEATLLSLASWFHQQEATFRHDKVYALLGLTSRRNRIDVDYSKSLREIFEDVLMTSNRGWRPLDITKDVGHISRLAAALEVECDLEKVTQLLELDRSREQETRQAV